MKQVTTGRIPEWVFKAAFASALFITSYLLGALTVIGADWKVLALYGLGVLTAAWMNIRLLNYRPNPTSSDYQ